MENCKLCGKPLKKEGRTEHYGCRVVKKFFKKSSTIQPESNTFIKAVKTLKEKPELFELMNN